MDLGEEEVAHGSRAPLDAADLIHEDGRLEDLFGPERVLVVRVVDHADDVLDGVLLVLGLLEIDLGRGPLVLVDGLDRLREGVEECPVRLRIRLTEAARSGDDQGGRAPAENLVRGGDGPYPW